MHCMAGFETLLPSSRDKLLCRLLEIISKVTDRVEAAENVGVKVN